jgi:hypothetical protein
MIQPDELAICKRRGHAFDDGAGSTLHQGWVQCKWCGMWVREIRTREERADDPPVEERSQLTVVREELRKLNPR